jgi:SPP1 gp7 family putative phage head morphogenesis protein
MATGSDPAIIRILQEYRAALDARESSLMEEMARRWLAIEQGLDSDMLALAYEIEARRAEGRAITEQIVWRSERYQRLQGQLRDEIRKYNRDAVGVIAEAQGQNAELGIRAAQDAIGISYAATGAMGPMWNRINTRAVEAMIGFAGDGSPLYSLLKQSYPDAVDGLLQALVNGIARGEGAAKTATEMANGMGMGLDRALTIARTETARAYRTASTMQYRESGVVSGFYRLVKKATACMACLMLDGQRFTIASELEDHPRGKCTAVPQVRGIGKPVWETGPEYFKNLSPEEQAARMGGEKYELWQAGAFQLEDLAKVTHNATWGDSPRVASMAELVS